MDGAGNWQKFRNVTLVYLRPAMLPYAIYGFVITFNLFFLSYFMSGGGPFGRTELLVTQAYRLVQEQPALRRRRGVLGVHVLHPAGHHAGHQPADQGDRELRPMSRATAGATAPAVARSPASRLTVAGRGPRTRGRRPDCPCASRSLLQGLCLFVGADGDVPDLLGRSAWPSIRATSRARTASTSSRPVHRWSNFADALEQPSDDAGLVPAARLQQLHAGGVDVVLLGGHRRVRGLCLLAHALPGPAVPDDRGPGGADAARRRHHRAAVHPAQPGPDRRLQPPHSRWSASRSPSISGLLPFAIWNLKGYLDTIPKDLEEAAFGGWRDAQPVVLQGRPAAGDAGAGGDRVPGLHRRLDGVLLLGDLPARPATATPWRWRSTAWSARSPRPRRGASSARSPSCSRCPCRVVYIFFQRWIIGGLAIGGVKG